MRPDLGDILSGLQRLLQNDLVPGLATPFLAEQAMYATLVLEYCKKTWPRVHLALAEEHGDLRATLDALASQLGALPTATDLAATIRKALAANAVDVAATTLDVVEEKNRALNEVVSEAVLLLDAHAENGTSDAARATVDAYLRRHATRQKRELDALGLSW